ncbi:sodium:solute symporter family protein [Achromobacter aloeverae]|uniref:Sodium:solute symporter n=1 Tax=Achromobacter aloeverae TaxID=1750518 RepID=A0A4V1MRB8_9BURK|nr:sodium:solute symporter family protein [Achromobacter aloeverae]RXN82753.1 sodium:solute symporter [Achromobacter aloeverae]
MSTAIFIGFLAFSLLLSLLSKGRHGHGRQSAKDFFVGSRQFSAALVFFLSAGEIYSITTMAGLPGGIYAKGPLYGVWFLGYVLLAYPVGYFMAPRIWELGRRYDATTLPDLFLGYYGSPALEKVVAATAILFLLPWGQLQFTGLIAALKALGWHFDPVLLICFAAVLAFLYVAISGIRGSAYVAVLKDVLMVVAIVAVGVAVALEAGVQPVFDAAGAKFSTTMGAQDLCFTMSTILLQSLGFYVLPFNVQNVFTARSPDTIRRSLIGMPLYMFMFPFLVLASYYAISANLKLGSPNEAFFAAATSLLPEWSLGIIAAAASLSALVVLAGVCLCISTMSTRNLVPNLAESRQKGCACTVIVVYLLLSIVLSLTTSNLMVTLLNTAYNGITQFFPGVIIALFGWRIRKHAVLAGILTGQALALALYFTQPPLFGFSAGLAALLANVAVVVATGWVFQQRLDPVATR